MGTQRIVGQVIYVGPTFPPLGIHCGNIFLNGVFENYYNYFAACPALASLFIPVKQHAAVKRELNFDAARNMRGTQGQYVQLYREVQNWLANLANQSQTPKPKGVKVKHHA